MKKILKILVLIVTTFISITYVKAEEIEVLYQEKVKWLFSNTDHGTGDESYTYLYPSEINSRYDVEYMYQVLKDKYDTQYKNQYPYYIVTFESETWNNEPICNNVMRFLLYEQEPINNYESNMVLIETYDGETYIYETTNFINQEITNFLKPIGDNQIYFNPMYLYDSNMEIINNTGNDYYVESINLRINDGDNYIIYKNSSFDSEYIEVNLDNYEYVLLSLKDYSQTNAFQTNLQVKGQIGITPIYNFGQTSKDAITGVQVQDRCNLAYESYTAYPFYIIQSDLQNNAIYAVKECESGSSFKFDKTVFNITYVTQENKDNPTVTINGNTYEVIPYDELPSTATKNEEENYIPGESGSATDTGGLDSAISGVQKSMSEIWNTFTYFTDFVGQIFSSLPEEVRTILLSAFTITIMIGLIKIFVGK